MDINKILSKLFGNKSTRDMKLIQPWVEKVKAAYPAIQQLDNDGLRAKTKELQHNIQSSADDLKAKIDELKAKIDATPIEDRAVILTKSTNSRNRCSTAWKKHLPLLCPTPLPS